MLSDPAIIRLLENAYEMFHTEHRRERDPVSTVHRYADPRDREVVALIAAVLAYGNAKIILRSIDAVLRCLGDRPAQTLLESSKRRSIPSTFRHRFTTADDLEILLAWITEALKSHGSLEAFFIEGKAPRMAASLSSFVQRLTSQPLPPDLRRTAAKRSRNLKYLVSDPMQGSACKRLCLFMRWMVRAEDGIDLGIWTKVSPADLVLPIDTHILKALQQLSWTDSKNATWKVSEQATAHLRRLNPADPLKYDFALCHLSMTGNRLLAQ